MGYCAWIKGECPFEQPWPSAFSDICDECRSENDLDLEDGEEEE